MAEVSEQVVITRVFAAPREDVFRAWTDPDEVAEWYGPRGFDTSEVRIDPRIGGRYELTMVRRDTGAEFPIAYEIVELVAPELLVLRSDQGTTTRVELEDLGGQTRMRLVDGPYPAARGAEAGWNAAFDKLAARYAVKR
jgi:uncharacterized protein YndB with AHSA1/START domain